MTVAGQGATGSTRRGPRGHRGDVAERILDSARASFAENGYAGTTLQGIARGAGVDTKLVRYYFNDKEQLFSACLVLPAAFVESAQTAARSPLETRGGELVRTLVTAWGDPEIAIVLRTSLLIAGHSPRALRLVKDAFADGIIPAIRLGIAPSEREFRAGLIASQMLGLAFARYVFEVDQLVDVADDAVIAAVGATIQRYLDGPLVP